MTPAEVTAIVRRQDRVERGRAIDGDGLLWIVQRGESGLDASPKFDSAFGWRADGLPGFPLFVRRNRRLGLDIRRIVAAGGPIVCGTALNVTGARREAEVRERRGAGSPSPPMLSPRAVQLIGHAPELPVFTDNTTGILTLSGAHHPPTRVCTARTRA